MNNTVNTKKTFILWVHDQQFSKEELVINPDHFPKLRVNDILEISTPTNPSKKLCLRVKTLAPVKGALQISIAKYVASVFEFASRREVIVNIIPEKSAVVDFVELSFKDQYIGRSDMWRLKLSLQNECVYVLKKLAFAQVRAQVEEIVSNGVKVSSGLIDESTKFVFRSRSAKFVLFIQMSKEMWNYSPDGELYFEKAVNGFLKSLFHRWKSLSVNHTITIILFSRTFFDSTEILDEEPNIPRNSQGRLYQDFYKVVVSEETRPDWSSVLINLKREFNTYHTSVNWDIYGRNSALGKNSTASQGNFLEAINLGMSYFDKHYIDRDFTRTGQMIVVVSAGTGIFEVDHDINLITKQRMIDNGIGCDLICLNRHPLHIVPLFKYNLNPNPIINNNSKKLEYKDQYNVPYWLAISFFDENSVTTTTTTTTTTNSDKLTSSSCSLSISVSSTNISSSISSTTSSSTTNSNINSSGEKFDFEPQFRIPDPPFNCDVDYSVKKHYGFVVPKDPRKLPAFSQQKPPNKYTSHSLGVNSYEDTIFNLPPTEVMSGESNMYSMENSILDDYVPSDTDQSDYSDTEDNASTTPINYHMINHINNRKRNSLPINNNNTGSGKLSTSYENRQLRRNTTHAIQQQQQNTSNLISSPANSYDQRTGGGPIATICSTSGIGQNVKKKKSINPFTYDPTPFHLTSNRRRWSHLWFSPNTYIFGTTNVNPNPFLPNWKSLSEPASLPITTDYYPTQKELLSKYIEYIHTLTLSPDENEYLNNTEALLKELISQRLAQGYQLIMTTDVSISQSVAGANIAQTGGSSNNSTNIVTTTPGGSNNIISKRGNKKVYHLSLGHDFHMITYDPSNLSIQVKRYQRQNGRKLPNGIKYHYYLCTVHHSSFIFQTTTLLHQSASSYPWNALDNLICGNSSEFRPSLKYWRIQYAIIPQQLDQKYDEFVDENSINTGALTKQQNRPTNSSLFENSTTISSELINSSELNQNINNNTNNSNTAPILSPISHSPTMSPNRNVQALNINTSSTGNNTPMIPSGNGNVLLNGSASAPTSPVSSHRMSNQILKNSNQLQSQQHSSSQNLRSNGGGSAPGSGGNSSNDIPPPPLSTLINAANSGGGSVLNTSSNNSILQQQPLQSTSQQQLPQHSDPVPEHTEEERMAAFIKLKEFINSQIARNSNQTLHNGSTANKMEVKTINHSIFIGNDNVSGNVGNPGDSELYSIKEKLNPTNHEAIYYRMNLPIPIGIKMVDKKYRLRTYKKCWVGSEGIDWLLQNVEINTREEALNIGQAMMDLKLIKPVEKTQFADGFHYYRLKEDNNTSNSILASITANQINPNTITNTSSGITNVNNSSSSNFTSPPLKKDQSLFKFNLPLNSSSTTTNDQPQQQQQQSIVNSPKLENTPEQSPMSSPKQSLKTSATFTISTTSNNTTTSTNTASNTPSTSVKTSMTPSIPTNLKNSNNADDQMIQSVEGSPHSYQSLPPESSRNSTPIGSSVPTTPYSTFIGGNNYPPTSNSIPTNININVNTNNNNNNSINNHNNNIIDNYENPNTTEEIKIEMDSTKTDRYEWIIMKYDKTFCPSKYYHIEFKWMVSTGCVVDDFVNSCIRKAKQFGLTLIQIPLEKNYSPFYTPVHVKLAPQLMSPQVLKHIFNKFNLIPDLIRKRPSSLVKRQDLYLFNSESDVPYTEYTHRTGMLFVRIVEDGFLCIINNAPSNRQFLPAALVCLESFQKLCNQLNSTVPSIIYHTPDSPSYLIDPTILNASPQTNLLRSLPPGEANFLSLLAQGYSTRLDDEESDNNTNNNGGDTDAENESQDEHEIDQSMWESQEILYYSVMSRSPL
eukprot:gene9876-12114_t